MRIGVKRKIFNDWKINECKMCLVLFVNSDIRAEIFIRCEWFSSDRCK